MKSKLHNMSKKLVAILLLVAFSMQAVPVHAALSEDPLVNVVISEDEDRTVIAQVPQSLVEEYKENLKSESFRQAELNKLTVTTRATLPEGNIIEQRHMYYKDVRDTVNRLAGYDAFKDVISSSDNRTILGKLLQAAGCGNAIAFCAKALMWAGSDLLQREMNWWNDSLCMIVKRQISCVRVTHIENTKPTYPAAYLIIDRI